MVKIYLIYFFITSIAAFEYFDYQQISDCSSREYFSTVSLKCLPCGRNEVQSNGGYSCTCDAGFWRTVDRLDNGGGRGDRGVCVQCPPYHTSTSDAADCVKCQPPRQFNQKTRRCTPCPGNTIEVTMATNGTLTSSTCLKCAPSATPVDNTCRPCPYPHRTSSVDGSCLCAEGYQRSAGECVAVRIWNKIPDESSMYAIIFNDQERYDSALFRHYARTAVYMCKFKRYARWCHLLVNLCTLSLYDFRSSVSVCGQLRQLRVSASVLPPSVPPLYYAEDEAVSILARTRINQQYTINPRLQTSYLNLTVARFSLTGELLSLKPISTLTSAVCPSLVSALPNSLRFGVQYRSRCTVDVHKLLTNLIPTEFYQVYLYHSTADTQRLYSVPVRVLEYRLPDGELPNQSENRQQWQLVRRFFLVDTISTRARVDLPEHRVTPTSGDTVKPADLPQIIRYVASARLDIEMRSDESEPGLIYPPLLTLSYRTIRASDWREPSGAAGSSGSFWPPRPATVSTTVEINHTVELSKSHEQIEVAIGVLSAFAALWTVFRTWAWSNRHGKTDFDGSTILQFGVCVCGSLATVFLCVTLGSCFYWLVFFKQQAVAFLLLPDHQLQVFIRSLVIAAFCLKCVDVFYLLAQQVSVDIFLLDWERPVSRAPVPSFKSPTDTAPNAEMVSIWRTYFIANEWNELQILRKVSSTLRLVLMVFLLQVIGLINLAASTPDLRVIYAEDEVRPPDSFVCRFCIICVTFAGITTIQWLFDSLVMERFVSNPLELFVSLCSLSNISVFLLTARRHGFYIHGRSVHGSAQADLATLQYQLRRERLDLCARRGLAPGTDQQTFELLMSNSFRQHYETIMAPLHSMNGGGLLRSGKAASAAEPGTGAGVGVGTGGDGGDALLTPENTASLRAYTAMNKYLSAFIEHAIKDLDYTIKDKQYIETLFDMEITDTEERSILYNDYHDSFSTVLMYGHEVTLSIFEALLFCFVDLLSSDIILSACVVYCSVKVISAVRYHFGRLNLARKTLVDERFLI